MHIVTTGGAGFICSHIVDAYVQLGHEVTVIDDLSSGRRENLNPKARFVQADVRSPEAARVIEELRPDVLNHHAAQMDVRKSVADPRFDADVNLLGLINLLEASRKAGVKRVVFASSGGAAYGEQDVFPAPESHATRPASPYGVAKVASELYLSCFQQMYGLPFVALRYANVYGPRQNPHGEAGVVAIFASRALAKQPCTIYGDGLQTRDFVFVADVVRANVAALTTDFVGAVNIGTGREIDINTVYAQIARAAGFPTPATHAPGKIGEQRRSSIDPAFASKVLSWRPEVGFETGIDRTVSWFRGR
jgi:UDP-glucose 4-epimerase